MTLRRPHIAIYLRTSDDELDDCFEQTERCLATIQRLNIPPASLTFYSDLSSGMLPGRWLGEGVMAGVAAGDIDVVIIDRLDRLGYSGTLLQEVFDAIDRHGARLLCADGTVVESVRLTAHD